MVSFSCCSFRRGLKAETIWRISSLVSSYLVHQAFTGVTSHGLLVLTVDRQALGLQLYIKRLLRCTGRMVAAVCACPVRFWSAFSVAKY